MTDGAPPGDRARATALVRVPPEVAFRCFTDEIDQWWLRGLRYRIAGRRRGIVRLEPGVGGRLLESFEMDEGPRTVETGRVTAWEPPSYLRFEWRAVSFTPDERTVVEVEFAPAANGTLVTVTHRGWSRIRDDHPARHRLGTAAFVRMMGLWWGDLLSSLRAHAADRDGPR